ncbi:uncharacterized protein LOC108102101 [Drosophila ficusphila]|uniref:uncharacterized protein LOC108102101 n=1 Tax=Drosophila ficusphila TaxID=30025 RepID=UPI0007E61330|nr:uncharacterized protein LOC108102101 [Drosophila ficusphila]
MKFLIWFSLFIVCYEANDLEKNIIHEICLKPEIGPACQILKTYYWSEDEKKCLLTNHLIEPCGFFHSEKRCNEICMKESWTLNNLEKYVLTLS